MNLKNALGISSLLGISLFSSLALANKPTQLRCSLLYQNVSNKTEEKIYNLLLNEGGNTTIGEIAPGNRYTVRASVVPPNIIAYPYQKKFGISYMELEDRETGARSKFVSNTALENTGIQQANVMLLQLSGNVILDCKLKK